MSAQWIDLGSDVWAKFYTCIHKEPEHSGALIRFGGGPEDNDGFDRDNICVGSIRWCAECKGPTWELHSIDPLHVEPSIQTNCRNPNHGSRHGFIREGKWVEA
jgi:hypothetical protein